jgi:hypothetical protein
MDNGSFTSSATKEERPEFVKYMIYHRIQPSIGIESLNEIQMRSLGL